MSDAPAITYHSDTAQRRGILVCTVCAQLSRCPIHTNDACYCPRCGAALSQRKPDSIARTWACLLSAYILYLPANLMPIMDTHSLFDAQQDTILSGVIFLWNSGSWVTAAIVFLASIVTPIAKLLALTGLTISVQTKSTWRPDLRAKLYRFLVRIGRWSMLDIFVVAILAALVNIQSLAVIEAGPGAVAFGAVVVLTLLAVLNFDQRLLWDAQGESREPAAAPA